MAKELSELLADLTAQSKQVEDAFVAMAEDTAAAAARRDKSRAAAAAVDTLERGAASVEGSVAGSWRPARPDQRGGE